MEWWAPIKERVLILRCSYFRGVYAVVVVIIVVRDMQCPKVSFKKVVVEVFCISRCPHSVVPQ